MTIKDRIKGLRRIKAGELRPNPRNWRVHSPAQQEALRGILAEVGYVDALIARQLKDGSYELIDGHLRAETTPETKVPVLVVDISDAEAGKVLASLDPICAMAGTDSERLTELMSGLSSKSEALTQMWAGMTQKMAEATAPAEFREFDENVETQYRCPKCNYKWSGSPDGKGDAPENADAK